MWAYLLYAQDFEPQNDMEWKMDGNLYLKFMHYAKCKKKKKVCTKNHLVPFSHSKSLTHPILYLYNLSSTKTSFR